MTSRGFSQAEIDHSGLGISRDLPLNGRRMKGPATTAERDPH